MSRLEIASPKRAKIVMEGLYKDLERRIESSPPGLCPVDMARAFLELCHAQTCGKCVPCRIGLGQLNNFIREVLDGKATMKTLDIMEQTALSIMESADCAIGYEAANMVYKGLIGYRDDYIEHIQNGRCTCTLTRLKAGNIYKKEKIQTALNNFFKTENILQLRELALKEVAFRVERKVESEVTPLAPTQTRREKILACVSSNEHTPRHIIRKAYRLSTRYSTSFIALHVQTPKESPDRIKLSSQRYLLNYFQLVTELGGKVEQMSSPNVTDAIVQFCKENQVTTVCMGRPAFEMPEMFFKIGRYKRFLQQLSEMRIDLIIVA